MTLYATYFDSAFLARGLACLQSLARESAEPPRFLVLALDDACAEGLRRMQSLLGGAALEVMTRADIEARHPALAAARGDRSAVEYFFTLTPFLCAEALARTAPGGLAVYLDADLYFYADPAPLLAAGRGAPAAIIEHRYPATLAHLADLYGRFNVGWLSFTPGPGADACLETWQAQCLSWCKDTADGTRFGDQKYLDAWPATVAGLAIIDHPGANLAPWNIARHRITTTGGKVLSDGQPLIFFHFHRLDRTAKATYEADFGDFGRIEPVVREAIYRPYLEALDRAEAAAVSACGWRPAARLSRFAAGRPGLKAFILRLLRGARLFTRRRAIFHEGRALSPWRALFNDR